MSRARLILAFILLIVLTAVWVASAMIPLMGRQIEDFLAEISYHSPTQPLAGLTCPSRVTRGESAEVTAVIANPDPQPRTYSVTFRTPQAGTDPVQLQTNCAIAEALVADQPVTLTCDIEAVPPEGLTVFVVALAEGENDSGICSGTCPHSYAGTCRIPAHPIGVLTARGVPMRLGIAALGGLLVTLLAGLIWPTAGTGLRVPVGIVAGLGWLAVLMLIAGDLRFVAAALVALPSAALVAFFLWRWRRTVRQ